MKKDFNEFIDSIDSDDYNTAVIAAHSSMKAASLNSEDALAFFIALGLLERYHNWTNE